MRRILPYASFLCLLIACTTERKAVRFLDEHPVAAAGYCATRFPVVDSFGEVKADTLSTPNEDLTPAMDSLLADLSTAGTVSAADYFPDPVARSVDRVKVIRAKYVRQIPDTIRLTNTVYRAGTANTKNLEARLAVSEENLKNTLDRESKWRLWCLVTWGVVALYVFAKLKFRLPA